MRTMRAGAAAFLLTGMTTLAAAGCATSGPPPTSTAAASPVSASAASVALAPSGRPADAPSSCRPANYRGRIAPIASADGYNTYRVTLTAAPSTSACAVQGIPTDVAFTRAGTPTGITADPLGQPNPSTTLEPGRPVHFDIRVPQKPDVAPTAADGVTFGIPGVPGTGAAVGPMQVQNTASQVGPFGPGA